MGNVTVTYGNYTLLCEKLMVKLYPKTQKVREVSASGNVIFTGNNLQIFGDRALYFPGNKTVYFFGHVVLKKNKGISKADELIYKLDTKELKLISKKNVQTVIEINPREKHNGRDNSSRKR
jgi:lipopolysaccharide transport protein LptA